MMLWPPSAHMQMYGIAKGLEVTGIGIFQWHAYYDEDKHHLIETKGCSLPNLHVHLHSPQAYVHIDDESC